MKDMLKKLGTLALTFVVMFSMVTNVFAATQGTITLHTGKHNVKGVEFKVYQMGNQQLIQSQMNLKISLQQMPILDLMLLINKYMITLEKM